MNIWIGVFALDLKCFWNKEDTYLSPPPWKVIILFLVIGDKNAISPHPGVLVWQHHNKTPNTGYLRKKRRVIQVMILEVWGGAWQCHRLSSGEDLGTNGEGRSKHESRGPCLQPGSREEDRPELPLHSNSATKLPRGSPRTICNVRSILPVTTSPPLDSAS